LDFLYATTLAYLKKTDAIVKKDNHESILTTKSSWDIEVKDYTRALEAIPTLLKYHNWLHERQLRVEVFIRPTNNDPEMQKNTIKVGAIPPTSNVMSDWEDIYFHQYLPDHSLPSTRLVHTIATVMGVSAAVYGIFSSSWLYIPLGIGLIYESGFHAHLFLERNIPSSTKYLLGSVYSDIRVTLQTLLNAFTGGMDRDLEKAGIYDVTKKVIKQD
jgi:hypothetical protein